MTHNVAKGRLLRKNRIVWLSVVLLTLAGCASMPSESVSGRLLLPVPAGEDLSPQEATQQREQAALFVADAADRPPAAGQEHFVLTPLTVVRETFDRQPAIKDAYNAFKAEEARYDFFYTSRDSFTPGARLDNEFSGERDLLERTRQRQHTTEVFVEKQFFNTSRADLAAGYHTFDEQWGDGQESNPFVRASLRYPLGASRAALQRASEEIFRQNQLNDAQLEYLQTVRFRLRDSLFYYNGVLMLSARREFAEQWLDDLQSLVELARGITDRDVTADIKRIQAEIDSADAKRRDYEGRYEIEVDWLKSTIGLPFDSSIKVIDEPFNPFKGMSHDEVIDQSAATDPEISALKNAVYNAQVQLDLARRGKWDASLLVSGESNLEGSKDAQGHNDWKVNAGVVLQVIDRRVRTSLEREAQANIRRYTHAILARKNEIHVEARGPMINIATSEKNAEQLSRNLTRYVQDYNDGVAAYRDGALNINDLLTRRDTLFDQQNDALEAHQDIIVQVARLCSATGKFFDLLNHDDAPPPAPNTD